jgi:hypothetical protein
MTKKVYTTHDNGGRPFQVEVEGTSVSVWKNMDTFEKVNGTFVEIKNPPKHILDFTVDALFVGKKSPNGGYDGLKPKEAEGNSILLQVGPKYVFIGTEIFEFTPVKDDTIVKFYSDIVHSDVAYPYAVGKTHMYMLLDKVAIPLDFFHSKNDVYQEYYAASTFLPMCLKGYQNQTICKDKKAAKERIQEVKDKERKLKVKVLQKRIF